MKKYPLLTFIICLLSMALSAQTNPKLPTAQKKQKVTEKASDIPPRMEQLEATKIDPVGSPALNFDTTTLPADELTEAIKKLLLVTGAEKQDVAMAEVSLNQSLGHPTDGKLKEFKERFLTEMREGRARRWLQNVYIRNYGQQFSLAEVTEMIQFYATPLGQKLLSKQPLLQQGILVESQKIGAYLGADIMHAIETGR